MRSEPHAHTHIQTHTFVFNEHQNSSVLYCAPWLICWHLICFMCTRTYRPFLNVLIVHNFNFSHFWPSYIYIYTLGDNSSTKLFASNQIRWVQLFVFKLLVCVCECETWKNHKWIHFTISDVIWKLLVSHVHLAFWASSFSVSISWIIPIIPSVNLLCRSFFYHRSFVRSQNAINRVANSAVCKQVDDRGKKIKEMELN